MEYVPGGDLFSLIESKGGIGEDQARFYLAQILDALEYLHGRGIAHRDIKPENILLDENMDIKITDFGFASK